MSNLAETTWRRKSSPLDCAGSPAPSLMGRSGRGPPKNCDDGSHGSAPVTRKMLMVVLAVAGLASIYFALQRFGVLDALSSKDQLRSLVADMGA